MNVRFTSVVWDSVAENVQEAIDQIERTLGTTLTNDYGMDIDFLVVIVAVSADPIENDRFAGAHNKVGLYRQWPQPEERYLWSMAVKFVPEAFEAKSVDQLRELIAEAVAREVAAPAKSLPKRFNYADFRKDVLAALS